VKKKGWGLSLATYFEDSNLVRTFLNSCGMGRNDTGRGSNAHLQIVGYGSLKEEGPGEG